MAWRRRLPGVALVVVGVSLLALPGVADNYVVYVMTRLFVYVLVALGLNLLTGYAGQLSLGTGGFMAVGAYVSALLTMKSTAKSVFLPDLPAFLAQAEWASLPGALAGGAAAALLAFLVGLPLMRLSGISASIATFAVLVITYVVLGN